MEKDLFYGVFYEAGLFERKGNKNTNKSLSGVLHCFVSRYFFYVFCFLVRTERGDGQKMRNRGEYVRRGLKQQNNHLRRTKEFTWYV